MYTGKVIGSLVSTKKYEALKGIKLLVVQVYENQKPGKVIIAADATRVAGHGDYVYLIGSREAAMAFGKGLTPVDAGIVGIIDQYNVNPKI
jgi:ethanolamine utilization protein EutN